MKWLPARPTVYRGIRMRSRLEADFARWLDTDDSEHTIGDGGSWKYEPECFAGPSGQYLPDFGFPGEDLGENQRGPDHYIEVKPAVFPLRDLNALMQKMEVIWESNARADLSICLWRYKADKPEARFYADGWFDRLWYVEIPGSLIPAGNLLWTGRGQETDLQLARGNEHGELFSYGVPLGEAPF